MKVHHFRLATLSRLREAVRDERRKQLAETLGVADATTARRDELDGELEELKRCRAAPAGTVDVERLLDADRYEALLRLERGRVEQRRQAFESEIEKRREALLAADRDVRALEHLADTHERRRLAEEDRRGMKELDEVAQRRQVVG
ncbi:MAG TPA: flagellar FliJ family protein [Pirellulales bacterium]|nr:flagellar FliJ family protein [Pirellulales bacterium]